VNSRAVSGTSAGVLPRRAGRRPGEALAQRADDLVVDRDAAVHDLVDGPGQPPDRPGLEQVARGAGEEGLDQGGGVGEAGHDEHADPRRGGDDRGDLAPSGRAAQVGVDEHDVGREHAGLVGRVGLVGLADDLELRLVAQQQAQRPARPSAARRRAARGSPGRVRSRLPGLIAGSRLRFDAGIVTLVVGTAIAGPARSGQMAERHMAGRTSPGQRTTHGR
jgi:hypothetical protein